jgi:hypothetical protein
MDCGSWWLEHIQYVHRYVTCVHLKDSDGRRDSLWNLIQHADFWGELTHLKVAGDLMRTYVQALGRLVDAAFEKDVPRTNAAVEELLRAVYDQTDLYRAKMRNFPSEDWSSLFMFHVTATGGYILALAEGDEAGFRKQYEIVRGMRSKLASFWVDFCLTAVR